MIPLKYCEEKNVYNVNILHAKINPILQNKKISTESREMKNINIIYFTYFRQAAYRFSTPNE